MAHKQASPGSPKRRLANLQNIAVPQGADEYKVGPGHPPKEYQFQPGQSGNPDGCPKHRTNLWLWFCKYMAMTADERAKIDCSALTAAQETAFKMVERAVQGEGCGFERLARYIVDREEGKAVEHIVISDEETLTDEECEELRHMILERHAGDDRNIDQ